MCFHTVAGRAKQQVFTPWETLWAVWDIGRGCSAGVEPPNTYLIPIYYASMESTPNVWESHVYTHPHTTYMTNGHLNFPLKFLAFHPV